MNELKFPPRYTPSPLRIQIECVKIRKKWSAVQEKGHRVGLSGALQPFVPVSTSLFGKNRQSECRYY